MTDQLRRPRRKPAPVRRRGRALPALAAIVFGMAASAAGVDPAQAQAPAAPQAQKPARPAQAQPPKRQPAAQKPTAQSPAAAANPSPGGDATQPQLLGQYGEWGAYAASPGGRKVCFALAKPAKAQTVPPNRPRDSSYLFISSRPAEKVRDEVSVIFGYPFKPNTDAAVEIAGASFAMYTQADGGWIKNAAEEPRLIETMRKASDITVKGVSSRGTATTDVYSLKGLAQALDRLAQECR